ncbi:LysR family transcriptional regulator [Anianabacter salinae]|uniref:LysR family transcriptional regulator n=1 Tax=Anianabacter salinae TaxID=2851023 RepID=UPI00225DEA2F|nr:LysR family transcriptional regulator [Anianabacter salinae]MBV0910967.1 LysR family transcriptional regulator [Anianabacter salinae]
MSLGSLGNWDEIRTAFQVARMGTVSGAADVLGVHHATVIRHIDALEQRLGTKLFQRHARGYTATEAGRDLLQVAQTTDDQFTQLAGRIKGLGEAMTGELIVTTLPEIATLMTPALVAFQEQHPELIVRFLTDERLFRLEYGEAHVAIRAGAAPDQPDNVVQKFIRQGGGFYASKRYVDRHGMVKDGDLTGHRFVAHDNEAARAPFDVWLRANVHRSQVTYRATSQNHIKQAVLEGAGIGFFPLWHAQTEPQLIEMIAPREEFTAQLWLVTHVDLHRSAKVQTFTQFLKDEVKSWPGV